MKKIKCISNKWNHCYKIGETYELLSENEHGYRFKCSVNDTCYHSKEDFELVNEEAHNAGEFYSVKTTAGGHYVPAEIVRIQKAAFIDGYNNAVSKRNDKQLRSALEKMLLLYSDCMILGNAVKDAPQIIAEAKDALSK